MKVMKLIVVSALVVSIVGISQASIITGVDRTGGRSANKLPVGVYDGDTDPLSSNPLADGELVFSDREYPLFGTPAEMIGYEYVRAFNDDKDNDEYDVSYMVTIGEAAPLWIAVDDRLATHGEFNDLLAWVELATYRLPANITFADTGLDLVIREKSDGTADRPMSVFMTTEDLPAGTYDFGLNPGGKNFYILGTVPEPATFVILGLGGLLLRRRR